MRTYSLLGTVGIFVSVFGWVKVVGVIMIMIIDATIEVSATIDFMICYQIMTCADFISFIYLHYGNEWFISFPPIDYID